MPKRTDIKSILVIGSGPIIIGQACEFDYSGSQACKALRSEGYRVILVNSNPATIMTDPEMADKVYIEPLVPEILESIIARERPDALLPTLGGQIALNLASELAEKGVLERYGVELIGADYKAIRKAEDRLEFKQAMQRIGLKVPESEAAYSVDQALDIAERIGYPVIIKPSYTLGGTGGGIAFNSQELKRIASKGLEASRVNQILVEQFLLGWKEFELEVMRDIADNFVVICSIENFDPMGIHTGDSITVAPAQTLSNKDYQRMRDYSKAIISEIGVQTGGSNIQFALNPWNGEIMVIEMNPRVSRSSALASKATGFPIAKIAAKLAVGLRLDEIPNDITKQTPASFEPTIDYVVVKIPRWGFEKFREADPSLGSQMKSVGEVMAIGRSFQEALMKAIRSLEIRIPDLRSCSRDDIIRNLRIPNHNRLFYLFQAFRAGFSVEEVHRLSYIDPWFLHKIKQIVELESQISKYDLNSIPRDLITKAKLMGFGDSQLAKLLGCSELEFRAKRKSLGIIPVYKLVDTCAAEFEAVTPYYYSCYELEDEVRASQRKKIVIIGSGPNRIGQGIEFDYCCVHASKAARELGYEVIMINNNPETVSTDYDTSDKLYFEPLDLESVLNIIEKEEPQGVVVQFGGQTPIDLCLDLERAGANILGTPPWAIDIAEDRSKFYQFAESLGIPIPAHGIADCVDDALKIAEEIGYPVIVRPSYVLGGRGMEIVYDRKSLEEYVAEGLEICPGKPLLIDKFLENAIEAEIDAVFDGERILIGGIMEHVEEAGIHSGDSACVTPAYSLTQDQISQMIQYAKSISKGLQVRGLINIQFAVKDGVVYVLEVNPRASRTVPFLSKATGIPLAKIAMKIMLGKSLAELGVEFEMPKLRYYAVKEVVLPFDKLPGADTVLGPEMKSTGEVMGIDMDFETAFYKSQLAAGNPLPLKGNVFISIRRDMNPEPIARIFHQLGFKILATQGTGERIQASGIPVEIVPKISDYLRPNVLDYIQSGKLDLIINIPMGKGAKSDGYEIRRAAVSFKIPYITTISGAIAAARSIAKLMGNNALQVRSLDEIYSMNLIE